MPHLTCNAATYHFRDIKIWDFGAGILGPLRVPPNGRLCPGAISTITKNFMLIGVNIAKIYVTKQTELQQI